MTLTEKQQALADYMSEISELSYCAGWMDGTEYRLGDFLTVPSDDGDWGQYPIQAEARPKLKELSDAVDGWIRWSDEARDTVFVAQAEWVERFATWNAAFDRTLAQRQLPDRYLTYGEAFAFFSHAAAAVEDDDDVAVYDARKAEEPKD